MAAPQTAACVRAYPCYCADPVCGHTLESRSKKSRDERKVRKEIKMKWPLSLLLCSFVGGYPREKGGGSAGRQGYRREKK